MKLTIKRYDLIEEKRYVDEIFITGNDTNASAENTSKLWSEMYPDSTISVEWENYYGEKNFIKLAPLNQKIDEQLLELDKITWEQYCKKWYKNTFSTEFLKGIKITKS